MKTIHKILLNLSIIFTLKCFVRADLIAQEGRAIAECLERFGGPTLENAKRLQRFKQWSDSYEEIPCFTNCYLNKMFDFYNETKGFDEANVIQHFGATLHTACKSKLIEGSNQCEVAYNGFHCLVSLENDPFVIIEGMDNLQADAKSAMKDCLHKFDPFEWQSFGKYSKYPVKEPIPCYTNCFVNKLQLYNHRLHKWNIKKLHSQLGLPANNVDINGCLAMRHRSNTNPCAWMYREFTCFVMAK